MRMPATAAAVPVATITAEILLGRQAPQLQRFVHKAMDRLLHLMQLLLRIQKPARNWIGHQRVSVLFEIGNLFAAQLLRHLLFLLERLTFIDQAFVLVFGALIAHERVDALADRAHVRLVENSLAEFAGFLQNRRLFGNTWHIIMSGF